MVDGIRYRVSVDFKPTKREAEEIIGKHIENHGSGQNQSHRMTFEVAGNAYIELKSNILSPSTIIGYQGIIRRLPEWFRCHRIDSITALDVQQLINDLSAKLSEKSVRNYHGFISAVLSTYRENLHLNTSLPQKGKFEPYTPIDDDIKRILSSVAGSEYEIAYRLAVYGLRKGEICALTAADLEGNHLTINKAYVLTPSDGWIIRQMPKTTDSIRTIYIDDELASLIRATEGRLFQKYPDRLTKHLHQIQDSLGIPRFRLHDFRAYYASMAHAIGIPDKYIMANGGWSSTHILDRVYKRAQSDVQDEANRQIAAHIMR